MTEQELLKLKKQITEAKETVARLQGRLEAAQDDLREKWHCDTIEEAETLLASLRTERDNLQKSIDTEIAKLEADYELNEY